MPTVVDSSGWIEYFLDGLNALRVLAVMRQSQVIDLKAFHAISSADLSHRLKLSLADGIIYTTAKLHGAKLLTQDADLEGLGGVEYIPHPKRNSPH